MSGFYGQVYQVIEKRDFDRDISIGKSLTVNENANVKQDLEIGKNLTVNENANIKQGLQVGENISIQNNKISIKGSLGGDSGTYDSLVFLKDNGEAVASMAVTNVGTLVFDLPSKNSDYFERYYFTGSEETLTENKEYYILTSKNVSDDWLSILKEEDGAKLLLTEEGYLVATGLSINGPLTQTGRAVSLSSSTNISLSAQSIGTVTLSLNSTNGAISLVGLSMSLKATNSIEIGGGQGIGKVTLSNNKITFSEITTIQANDSITLSGLNINISSTKKISLSSDVYISGITTLKDWLVLDKTNIGTTKGKGKLGCFNLQNTINNPGTEGWKNPQLHVFRMEIEEFTDYDNIVKSGAAGLQCGGIFLENGCVNAYGEYDPSQVTAYEGRLYFQYS